MRTFRPVLGVVVLAAAVAFSLSGGAGSGSGASTEPCPPLSGRQFCITITDTQPVSASVDGVVAYRVNDMIDLGVGVTALYADAELTNALPNISPLQPDGSQALKGDGWAYGYTVGASIAYAYLPAEHDVGTEVAVEIFGEWIDGVVADEPLFDPAGEKIRP